MLDSVARNLEPSKRIWWREEFGGCAPDREPLDSEMQLLKGEDRGHVLRTSPPSFGVESYRTSKKLTRGFARKGTNTTSPHQEFNRTTSPSPKAKPQKGTTRSIPDRLPLLEIPPFSGRRSPRAKEEPLTKEDYGSLRERPDTGRLRGNYLFNTGISRQTSVAYDSSLSAAHFVHGREADETLATRFADVWTDAEDLSGSSFRGPAVRSKIKPPQSPTRYIPDRLPPLKSPNFSKSKSHRHKRKELTAEEDDQLLQSCLQKLAATEQEVHRYFDIPHEPENTKSTEISPSTIQGGISKIGPKVFE